MSKELANCPSITVGPACGCEGKWAEFDRRDGEGEPIPEHHKRFEAIDTFTQAIGQAEDHACAVLGINRASLYPKVVTIELGRTDCVRCTPPPPRPRRHLRPGECDSRLAPSGGIWK